MKLGCAIGVVAAIAGCCTQVFGQAPCTEWLESTPSAMPPTRFLFGIAYDEARSRTVLFGGESSAAEHEFGDTWLFDGAAWTQANVTGPSDRSDPVMAYDPVRHRVVLFGGSFVPETGGRVTYGQTWEWDGAQWHLASEAGPSPRQSAAMAFDALRNRIVMAGGVVANVASGYWDSYGDCWEWDGQDWTQVPSLPDPRGGARMVFDSARNQLVLFGGSTQFGGPATTTLVRTGTTWTVATTEGPAPRGNHMMAFLPTLGETVLYGGTVGNPDGEVNDTWLWDGSAWHQPLLAASPPRRQSAGMVYDAARDRLVMVFGFLVNTSTFLSEQWEFLADSLSIITQPTDQALLLGQNAAFHIEVSNTPAAIQWRKDGEPLNDGDRISGAQTTTLTISGMQSSDQGEYDCVVSNDCSSLTSDVAELTCRPVFTQSPTGGTFQAGRTIVLTAAVASEDAVSYRWRKDGNNLFNSGLYSGVTTPVLTIHAQDPTQSGIYTLKATNGCGTTFSAEAEVNIYCGADFDRSGFVDTDDFTAFVFAFEEGTDNADFDASGFVDTDDFTAFVLAFEAGC